VTEGESPSAVVRPMERSDFVAVAKLIQPFVEQGILLPRTRKELLALLPHGFVGVDQTGKLVGFAALEIYSSKLAEIRSLVVSGEWQGKGLGRQLVEACVNCARVHKVLEVMAITSNEDFFRRCGFDFTLPGEKKALFITTRDAP
jgi:N-acetylglutamate synthase-like GNAT family acetyltransferase